MEVGKPYVEFAPEGTKLFSDCDEIDQGVDSREPSFAALSRASLDEGISNGK